MSLSSLDQEIIQKWVILIKQKNLMPFLLRHLSSLFTSFGLKAVIPAPIGQKPGFFFFIHPSADSFGSVGISAGSSQS